MLRVIENFANLVCVTAANDSRWKDRVYVVKAWQGCTMLGAVESGLGVIQDCYKLHHLTDDLRVPIGVL